jgi:hypothetical protein
MIRKFLGGFYKLWSGILGAELNIGVMMGLRVSLSISPFILRLIPQQYNALTTHTSNPELIFHEMNNEIF